VWLRIDMEAAVMDCSYVWRRRRKYDIDITRDHAILSIICITPTVDLQSTEASSPR
jgi:hypothetical protein